MSIAPMQVIEAVRAQTDSVTIFCSLGKDSLVTLDMAYPRFRRVVCVFMYFVKGLTHIDRWIAWLQSRYPRIEFMQVPHWNLTYILRSGLYCVANPKVRLMKLRDVVDAVRLKTGIDYTMLGMKMADGMNRRLMLKGYAQNHYINKGLAYPLAEWTQKDVLAYMCQHHLPEPVRYSPKASSGIGFNADCLLWMEEHAPQDLKIIYRTFPMAERVLWEAHNRKRKEASE